jgi:hypothetical protein
MGTVASVGTPFAPGTRRVENGAVMAGPDCVFSPTCKDIATQSLRIFKRLGHVTVRSIYVDERLGIVALNQIGDPRMRTSGTSAESVIGYLVFCPRASSGHARRKDRLGA